MSAMLSLAGTRVTLIWIALVTATLVSWALGTDHGVSEQSAAGAAVLVIAFAKARFVGLDFMELREAPLALRGVFEGYCLIVLLVVLTLFLGG